MDSLLDNAVMSGERGKLRTTASSCSIDKTTHRGLTERLIVAAPNLHFNSAAISAGAFGQLDHRVAQTASAHRLPVVLDQGFS